MSRHFHRWHSPHLQKEMELLVFGTAGPRAIVFPTSCGRYFDWEQRGLVRTLAGPINAGRLQLICVDSVDGESWYAEGKHPADRARRQEEYDRYIAQEVAPFSKTHNPNPTLISVGASFGGYHAINFGLRHPDLVDRALSMSGLFDISRFVRGYHDDNIYFHNPCDYIINEHDDARLEQIRHMDLIIAIGREDPLFDNNQYFSNLLWGKGVWHAFRVWDGFAHDWPVWESMLHLYLFGHD